MGILYVISTPSKYRAHRIIDLNLPITGLAIAIVFFFLHLNVPKQTFKEKMARMDWMYVSSPFVQRAAVLKRSFPVVTSSSLVVALQPS